MLLKCISGARQDPPDRLQNIVVPYWLRLFGEDVTPTRVPLHLLSVVGVVFVDSSWSLLRVDLKVVKVLTSDPSIVSERISRQTRQGPG